MSHNDGIIAPEPHLKPSTVVIDLNSDEDDDLGITSTPDIRNHHNTIGTSSRALTSIAPLRINSARTGEHLKDNGNTNTRLSMASNDDHNIAVVHDSQLSLYGKKYTYYLHRAYIYKQISVIPNAILKYGTENSI